MAYIRFHQEKGSTQLHIPSCPPADSKSSTSQVCVEGEKTRVCHLPPLSNEDRLNKPASVRTNKAFSELKTSSMKRQSPLLGITEHSVSKLARISVATNGMDYSSMTTFNEELSLARSHTQLLASSHQLSTARSQLHPTVSTHQLPAARGQPLPIASNNQAPAARGQPLSIASSNQLPAARSQPPLKASSFQLPAARGQPLPIASSHQFSAARGQPLPKATSHQLPVARGQPLPIASSNQLPAARGQPLPIASSNQLPAARGQPLPIASSHQLPTARGQPLPIASSNQLPAARGQPVPHTHTQSVNMYSKHQSGQEPTPVLPVATPERNTSVVWKHYHAGFVPYNHISSVNGGSSQESLLHNKTEPESENSTPQPSYDPFGNTIGDQKLRLSLDHTAGATDVKCGASSVLTDVKYDSKSSVTNVKCEPADGVSSQDIANVDAAILNTLANLFPVKNENVFELRDELKNIKPYVISGWISSRYLLALMRKTNLVNHMFDNALDDVGDIRPEVLQNCRKTAPSILARDLVFRVFTLGELNGIDLKSLSRNKMGAIRRCVKRQFPQANKYVWKNKCVPQIKASLKTLFTHRVKEVQDFWLYVEQPDMEVLTSKENCDELVDEVFEELIAEEDDMVHSKTLEVLGRDLVLPKTCGRVLDTTFDSMCCQPLGAIDYLEISQHFDSVIVRNIPKMTLKHKSEAKRFIVMIDTFYDSKVRIVCSAEVLPQELFTTGKLTLRDEDRNRMLMDDLGICSKSDSSAASIFTGEEELFAFERTISRLAEMQTEVYWGQREKFPAKS